jgi:hypothetical protein
VEISITMTGEDAVQRLLDRLHGEGLHQRVRAAASLSSARILAYAARISQDGKDTGLLVESLDSDIFEEGGDIVAKVFSPLSYAIVREFGRRPGKAMPPEGALIGWLKRHPAPAEIAERYPTIEARERALRWGIHAKGSPPLPFMRPAWRQNIRYTLEVMVDMIIADDAGVPRV